MVDKALVGMESHFGGSLLFGYHLLQELAYCTQTTLPRQTYIIP